MNSPLDWFVRLTGRRIRLGIGWLALLLLGWICPVETAAQTLFLREPTLLPDSVFHVVAESPAASSYLVLRRGDTPDLITTPIKASLPEMRTVLTDEDTGLSARRFYRVEAVPFSSPRDLDGDGLSDPFELAFPQAFDPLNPADAAGDFDGDGFDNFEEQTRGTDPTNPADRPLVQVSTSPASSEIGVSVNREVTVLFEKPVAAATQLSGDRFFLEFGGRRILARTELSSDRTRAWLFPLEPLPPGARMQVVFDSTEIRDALGREVDANGDGQPGGRLQFDYATFGATPVLGTAMIGRVFDSEPQPDGAGGFTNRPLAGVIITVDGAEQTLRATTDATGFFRLDPAPTGRFFVHVDGRPAVGSIWPGGAYYPFIGKAWEALPGRTNNLAGGSGIIYLPRISADTLQPVSNSADTRIIFPPTVLAQRPDLAGVSITVPANALFSDNGTRGGRVGIAPVPPDRLPEPLPGGLAFSLVITIQTDGPLNFDRPVPVRFPNLPDPVTGDLLPPGGKSLLWSFDHDTGRWEVQGTMTVGADGKFVETDPGVGVRQPGWHGTSPGCGVERAQFRWTGGDACAGAIFSGAVGCALSFVPAAGAAQCLAMGVGFGLQQTALSCLTGDTFDCGLSVLGSSFEIALCILSHEIPIVSQVVSCGLSAVGIAQSCFTAVPAASARSFARPVGRHTSSSVGDESSERIWRVFEVHLQVVQGYAELMQLVTGTNVWSEAADLDADDLPEQQRMLTDLMLQFLSFTKPGSDEGVMISLQELAAWKGAPRPPKFPLSAFDQMADYHNRTFSFHQQGIVTHAAAGRTDFMDRNALRAVILRLRDLFQELGALGETEFSSVDALENFLEEVVRRSDVPQLDQLNNFFFRMELLYSDVELLRVPVVKSPIYGRMLQDGRFPFSALMPKAIYKCEFYDPIRNLYAKIQFGTGPSGGIVRLQTIHLISLDHAADFDGDGLPGLGELVISSLDPSNPDSDGNGLTDRDDLLEALLSGVGGPLVTGVIAAIDTDGEAVDLAAHERYTVVADSGRGLAVVEVDGLNLSRAAIVPTPSLARAVAVDGHWAVCGDSLGILTLQDLSRPVAELGSPLARMAMGAPIWGVAVASPVAFVSLNNGQLLAVNLEPGLVLDRLTVSAQKLDDVVVVGRRVIVLAGAKLYLLDWDGVSLRRLGEAPNLGYNPSGFFVGRSRLFTDGSRVFVTQPDGFNVFDVTVSGLVLVRSTPTGQRDWKHLVALDNTRGIAAMGLNNGSSPADDNVSLYELSAPAGSDGFVSMFPTPGVARAVLSRQGFVYVADQQAGLQVLNLNSADRTGVAPTVTVRLAGATNETEPEQWMELVADAADDVAVREVEFMVNGSVVYTDTSFPFRHRLRAPSTVGPFVVAARAVDIGGNATLSMPLSLTVLPDTTAPRLLQTSPTFGAAVGALHEIVALFSERLDPATVSSNSVAVRAAGPDGLFDTADDALPAAATQTIRQVNEALVVSLAVPLSPGPYRLEISSTLVDLSGHPITDLFAPIFRVAGPADMTDTDLDGLPDVWETTVSGTDPLKADTNGNGLPDGDEDLDGDGLTTLFELIASTDPTKVDTYQTGRSDAELDADGDALTLRQELSFGTDPTLADTDGDGWNDEVEITLGSRPADPRSLPAIFRMASDRPGLARPAWEPGAGQFAAPKSVGLARPALESAADVNYGTSRGQPPLTLQRNEP